MQTNAIILILAGIYLAFISPILRARVAQQMGAAGRAPYRPWLRPVGILLILIGIGLAVWPYIQPS